MSTSKTDQQPVEEAEPGTTRSNLSQGSAPLLIMELAHPAHRGMLTTMYNTLWYVGSIVAAWTVFGCVGYTTNAAWRIPTAIQALMPVLQFMGKLHSLMKYQIEYSW